MSPFSYLHPHNATTNERYGGFYDSPRISIHAMPHRIRNNQVDSKKATHVTTSSEYGGFLHLNTSRPPRWFVVPEQSARPEDSFAPPAERVSPRPSPRTSQPESQVAEEGMLRFNDRYIHLPDVDTVELHMRDKSKILLSVKEFYRRYLAIDN